MTGELNNLQVLHCANGDHEWTRAKKRGRVPASCPDHPKSTEAAEATSAPPKVKRNPAKAMQEGKAKKAREDRKTKIKEIIDSFSDCDCGLHPDITDDELHRMMGCKMPWYLCPALVRVRGTLGLHGKERDA